MRGAPGQFTVVCGRLETGGEVGAGVVGTGVVGTGVVGTGVVGVGTTGAAAGVTGLETAENSLAPAALTARIQNVYDSPLVSPRNVSDVASGPATSTSV